MFVCFARKSRSERFVKDEAIKKMAISTMAMPEPNVNRLLKKPLRAEFTRIYISFYNSFTMKGNAVAYVWIGEVNQFLLIKIYKTMKLLRHYRILSRSLVFLVPCLFMSFTTDKLNANSQPAASANGQT